MQAQVPAIATPGSRQRIFVEIARRAVVAARADGVAVALDRGAGMVCEISLGLAPPRGTVVDSGSSLSAECLRTAATVYCADSLADPRFADKTIPFRSVLLAPILEDGRAVGFCGAFSARPNAFSAEQVQAFKAVVGMANGRSKGADAEPAAGTGHGVNRRAQPSTTSDEKLVKEIEAQIADWDKHERRSRQRRKLAFALVGALLITGSIMISASPPKLWEWLRPITRLFQDSSPQHSASPSSKPEEKR